MHIGRDLLALIFFLTGQAAASESPQFSYAYIISNDFIGDGQDRWHTGSYTMSATKVLGAQRGGEEYLELRFRSEIIAPSNLADPDPNDRPYVGILSMGLHYHARRTYLETSLGVDLVAVGEQTGLLDLQNGIHEFFGGYGADAATQIADSVYPTFLGEIAAPVALSKFALMRPFVEVQAGAETMVRSGVDFEFGGACINRFKIRDVTTGQRYRAHRCDMLGVTKFNLGFDFAKVYDSSYLPSAIGPEFEPDRKRFRLGVERAGKNGRFFFGIAWLGKEFVGQPESQVIGSISGALQF